MLIHIPDPEDQFIDYLSFYEARRDYPDLASRIQKEYDKLNGALPYETGYVYAIQAVGTSYYKLGKSINPDRRILQIAPQMPFSTRFIKVWRTNFMSLAESWLHNHFAESRSNGEWFDLSSKNVELLFLTLKQEYDEQIRHAYGSYFLNFVVNKSAESGSIRGVPNAAGWGGSALTIAWIESLFEDIASISLEMPSDVRQLCLSSREERLRGLS